MAAQQQPVPNIADLQAAVNGMTAAGNAITQNVQRYNGHQQTLNRELSRCANYDVAQIRQQLTTMQTSVAAIPAIQASITAMQASITAMQASITTMQASITSSGDLNTAQNWNLNARMENANVTNATGALVVMRSVQPGANPQVPVNQPIPNFPATPNAVSRMAVAQCHDILTALDKPIPQGAQVRATQLRTAVRQATGLLPL